MRSRSLLVAAVAALAGCSLSLKTDKIDPLKDAESYCDTLFSEFITKMDACRGATQYWVDQEFAQAKAMCANVARMNFTYDRGAAQQYIDGIRAADCLTFYQYMDDGAAALQGNVPSYGPCNSSVECAGYRAQCVNTSGTCPGQCFQQGVSGDPCWEGYPECASGYFCDMSSSGPGYPGTCSTYRGIGADCSGSYGGSCVPGSYCRYTGGSPLYQCTQYVGIGGDCSLVACQDGAYCYYDPSGLPYQHTCTAYQPVGAYCDGSDAYRCNANGDAPSTCDMASRRCVSAGHIGEPCVSGSWCMEGYCNAALSCAPSLGLGASCVVGQQACEMGAYCAGTAAGATGVCTTWPMHLGNPCGNINGERAECFEGYCGVTYSPGIYYCAAVKQVGDACSGYPLNDPCRPDIGMNEAVRCDPYYGTCTPSCN